ERRPSGRGRRLGRLSPEPGDAPTERAAERRQPTVVDEPVRAGDGRQLRRGRGSPAGLRRRRGARLPIVAAATGAAALSAAPTGRCWTALRWARPRGPRGVGAQGSGLVWR